MPDPRRALLVAALAFLHLPRRTRALVLHAGIASAKFALIALCAVVLDATPSPAQVPGRCETPVAGRTSDIGCYVSAMVRLGELPDTHVYWHLYTYPTRATAEVQKGARTVVVEAFNKVWLFAIDAPDWRPSDGERVAVVGPLHVRSGVEYVAHLVEAVFPPGMKTSVHRHPGPEASYVVAGEECVETPDGKIVSRAGEGAVVREGVPMQLHNSGLETRRAVAVILHDASHHWSALAPDWTPKGLCTR